MVGTHTYFAQQQTRYFARTKRRRAALTPADIHNYVVVMMVVTVVSLGVSSSFTLHGHTLEKDTQRSRKKKLFF